jgi:hypothetical protein
MCLLRLEHTDPLCNLCPLRFGPFLAVERPRAAPSIHTPAAKSDTTPQDGSGACITSLEACAAEAVVSGLGFAPARARHELPRLRPGALDALARRTPDAIVRAAACQLAAAALGSGDAQWAASVSLLGWAALGHAWRRHSAAWNKCKRRGQRISSHNCPNCHFKPGPRHAPQPGRRYP